MREEKKRLLIKINELEEDLKQSKSDIVLQQLQIERNKEVVASDNAQKIETIALDENDKRILQQKLRNIISKLDQYLKP